MQRMNWRTITISAFLWSCPGLMLADVPAQQPADAVTDQTLSQAEIQRWVADLDSDQFAERESATKKLIDAQARAIGPIVLAVSDRRRELIARGVYVLERLAQCGDSATEDAAQTALEGLAAEATTVAARRAIASLDQLQQNRQRRAVKALRWLGADVKDRPDPLRGNSRPRPFSIEIHSGWNGAEKDLVHLKHLVDIQRVIFRGPQVTDAWLDRLKSLPKVGSVSIVHAGISDKGVAHLCDIDGLRRLNICYTPIGDSAVESLIRLENAQSLIIYGSNITPAGADSLREKLVRTTVDVKQGAFLGIGAVPNQSPCIINRVSPASAAERAGLQIGDVISHYEGKLVKDFGSLRVLIGANRAGESVNVKINRGSQTLVKRIRLGEWDFRQLPY